ncbi:hypothetical protein [Cryobacterium sp. Y82]|nr:hypothetical protein [Cryobacterium sp. Y82]
MALTPSRQSRPSSNAPGETDRPHPINWNILSVDDAENEWIELNRW